MRYINILNDMQDLLYILPYSLSLSPSYYQPTSPLSLASSAHVSGYWD